MTKTQIVNKIARNFDVTKTDASKIVNTFCEQITYSLKRRKAVSFPGFGTFTVKKAGGFTFRNPRTGAKKKVPSFSMVVFTPAPSWDPSRRNRSARKRAFGRSFRNFTF